MRRLSVLTAAAALVMFAGTANAHPKLVSASPAANATVAKPARIELHFSEKLMPAFSKADLTMAATWPRRDPTVGTARQALDALPLSPYPEDPSRSMTGLPALLSTSRDKCSAAR